MNRSFQLPLQLEEQHLQLLLQRYVKSRVKPRKNLTIVKVHYLKYLVDTMTQNQVIWGVGRGSSVASYVLYKLEVHRIDSLHYNLDVTEFLR